LIDFNDESCSLSAVRAARDGANGKAVFVHWLEERI
jgi:hypothetical protein